MDRNEELRKALVSSSASGTALIPEDLEPMIRADLLELSPLTRMIPVVKADGNIHRVVRRTAHNEAAWFEGEMTDASYSQSTLDRRSVEVRILRTHGQASDFMVSAARSFTDVLVDEIESATEGMADLFEYSTIWGASDASFTGDAYQYDGVYSWLLQDAPTTNIVDAAGTITLSDLDSLMDVTMFKYRNIRDMQYLFLASPAMRSKISGLQTKIQRAVQTVQYEGGFEMETYRGVPILPSGFVKPASTSTSPSDLSATATGAGGATGHATGVYRYKIASITLYGEQVAGAAANDTITNGTHDYCALAWTADTEAKLYAIYRTPTDGADADANYDLLDIIPAKTYTGTGALNSTVASYNDAAARTALTNIHPMAAGSETIFLVGLSKNQGVARPVLTPSIGEPMDSLVNYVPLATTTDSVQFRLKSYHTLQVPWGALQGAIRRATVA